MKYHPSKEKIDCMSDDRGIFCTTSESKMVDVLMAMNTIVYSLNDEEAYWETGWMNIIDADADREDFEDIVKNYPDIAEDMIALFPQIVKDFMK